MAEGWELDETTVGAEGKELLGCMTWVGRRSAKKMCERIAGNMDWGRVIQMQRDAVATYWRNQWNVGPLYQSIIQ